jgi:hypothetical protein
VAHVDAQYVAAADRADFIIDRHAYPAVCMFALSCGRITDKLHVRMELLRAKRAAAAQAGAIAATGEIPPARANAMSAVWKHVAALGTRGVATRRASLC